VSVLMKPALQLVYNSTPEERTWVVRKPNAGVESVLVFCVPLGENSLECQCNGSRDRFCKRVVEPAAASVVLLVVRSLEIYNP